MIKLSVKPRMAEIGKIKIGMKGPEKISKGGKKFRMPKKIKHFIVTTTERTQEGNYKLYKTIMDKLGKEPREIRIRLQFDDIDMNFHTSYQCYSGKKLMCKGDGENASRRDLKTDTYSNVACNPETCKAYQAKKCKVSGILSCMIADVPEEYGGVFRFRTHSWNSVTSILASLKYFSDNTNGIMQGLPLKLKMVDKTTEEHGTIQFVTVVLDVESLLRLRELANIEATNRKRLGVRMKQIEKQALKDGFIEDTDLPEDIQEEWYPEHQEIDKGTGADDLKEKLINKKEDLKNKEKTSNKKEPDDKIEDAEIQEPEEEEPEEGNLF